MSSIYNIYDWYWKVLDSSPGTQVYHSTRGFVPLADSAYVAWLALAGGNTPSPINTLANLYKTFDTYNVVAARPLYQSLTISTDTTLTNPLPTFLIITPTVDNLKVIFPPMNWPGSLALGQNIRIRNNGAGPSDKALFFYANDGVTKLWTPIGVIPPYDGITRKQEITFTSTNNTTANGIISAVSELSAEGGPVNGAINIRGTNSPYLQLDKPASGGNTTIQTMTNGVLRWSMFLGNATPETGGGTNSGSDFYIVCYNDAGASLFTPMQIIRSTGIVGFATTVQANGPTLYQNMVMAGNASPGILLSPTAGATNNTSIFQELNKFYITNIAGNGIKLDLITAITSFDVSPVGPTPATADATSKFATTAYVQANLGNYLLTTTANATFAPLASPALTGNPTAPTQANSNSSTRLATTAFVRVGTATNDNAAAGWVGEYLEHLLPAASKITLTTSIPAEICIIILTPGDWDVWGVVHFEGGGTTTVNALQGSINTSTGALDFTPGRYAAIPHYGNTGGLSYIPTLQLPPTRFSVSAATTGVFLNAAASFGTAACQAYGRLMARRRR